MGNITDEAVWRDTVRRIELTDPLKGGADDAVLNMSAKDLSDRTAYLKGVVDAQQITLDGFTPFGLTLVGAEDAASARAELELTSAAIGDAAGLISGVLDPARIPVLAADKPIVSTGGIADLTEGQQDDIETGTRVFTTDGREWIYTGTGDKTDEASYIEGADVNPEWAVVANKPASIAALAALTPAANKAPYFTGAGSAALADVAATGLSLLALAAPTATAWARLNADGTVTMRSASDTLGDLGAAADSDVVHLAGTETIGGPKTFTDLLTITPANTTTTGLSILGRLALTTEGNNAIGFLSAIGATPSIAGCFIGQRAGGTIASQSAVQNGWSIAAFSARGHNGTSIPSTDCGGVEIAADGNFTGTSTPTKLVIKLCPTGSAVVSTVTTVTSAGHMLLGTTTDDGVNLFQANGSIRSLVAGSPSAPAVTFGAAGTQGFFEASQFEFGIAVSGATRFRFGSTYFSPQGDLSRALGSAGSRFSKIWTGDANIGAPTVPASSSAAGTTGDIAWDADYFYWCRATNAWNRIPKDATW